MRLTSPHYYDFGADRVHVGGDLVRPEAWDALRVKTDGPFSLPATRAQWERAADERPEIRERAVQAATIARARGVQRLASYGAGTALLELHLHRLLPGVELVLTDYAPEAVDRLTELFPEAEVRRHDLLADAPLEADLHLFHRIDTEFSNAQWRTVLHNFRDVPVLVGATEIIDLRRAMIEMARGLRNRNSSRAGWLRNRDSFESLWRGEHDPERLRLGDLDAWMLNPRR